MRRLIGLLIGCIVILPGAAEAKARFALIIGNNEPLAGSGYEPLHYADDDALRFAELMSLAGADAVVLTAPDAETRERFGAPALAARPPTVRELAAALTRLNTSIDQAKKRGLETELYVYFSGHGSVTTAMAHLHLLDGPYSRTDLHRDVLRATRADRVHVMIDSCHSYFLVNSRGDRIAVVDDHESLDRYPQIGFLLSTSRTREVHEWSGYRSGVFSYQLLGAMLGAADVDGNGAVSYVELHAYVAAANEGVLDPAARIAPFVHAPVLGGDVLIDLAALAGTDPVAVPETLSGHFQVVDERGFQVLDANKPGGLPMVLRLPRGRPMYLRKDGQLYAAPAQDAARRFEEVSESGELLSSRGPVSDQFRLFMFQRPLTPDLVAGFALASRELRTLAVDSGVRSEPWSRDPITLGLLGTGAAALAVGAAGTGLFAGAKQDAEARPVTPDTEGAIDRASTWRAVMVGGFAAGAALLTAGVVRAIFTNTGAGDATIAASGAGLQVSF